MKDREISERAAQIIRWIIAFIIFCVGLNAWGCAPKSKTIIEYKEVKIPVNCSIEMPVKPNTVNDPVEMNLLILRYTQELEAALRSCL